METGDGPLTGEIEMTTFPVLDDNTKDAWIIGEASSAAEAAQVYATEIGKDLSPAERAEVVYPTMLVYRMPESLAKNIAADCPNGAWEPVWG